MEEAAVPESRPNYFTRHWRGELSLARSFWINEVLLGLLVLLALAPLYFLLIRYPPSPASLLILLAVFLVFTLAMATWQGVGVWRSARLHQQRGGKQRWVLVVRLLIIAGVIHTGVSMVELVPTLKSALQLALNPNAFASYRLTPLSETELEFSGGIAPGSLAALEQALAAKPTVKVIQLDSGGGLFGEARAMAMLIEEKRLTTFTNGECMSACALMFMAGKERLLGSQGVLGFHAAKLFASHEQSSAVVDQYRDALLHYGASKGFVAKVLATGPQDMWFPNAQELKREHIITDSVDAKRFTDARLVRLREPGMLDNYLLKFFQFKTLAQVAPEQLQSEKAEAQAALNSAATFAQFREQVRQRNAWLGDDYLRKTPNPQLLQFWRTQVALLQALYESSAQDCTAHITGLYPAAYHTRQEIPQPIFTAAQDAGREMIKAAVGVTQNVAPSASARADLDAVFAAAPAGTYEVYARPRKSSSDPEKLCTTFLDLYRRLLALPDNDRVAAAFRQLPSYRP